MASIKLQTDGIRAMAAFEKVTGVGVKDCLIGEACVYFLIEPGKMSRVFGRGGNSIRELRRVFNKSVKLYEYAEKPEEMIKNMIPGASNIEIEEDGAKVSVPMENRSEVIGRGGRNIKAIKELLNRQFRIKNLILRR